MQVVSCLLAHRAGARFPLAAYAIAARARGMSKLELFAVVTVIRLCRCCLLTDNPEFKRRILTALGLLVGAKVLNVQVCDLNNLVYSTQFDLGAESTVHDGRSIYK